MITRIRASMLWKDTVATSRRFFFSMVLLILVGLPIAVAMGLTALGFFIGLTLGQQRWIKTLGIDHGAVLGDTSAGLAPASKLD